MTLAFFLKALTDLCYYTCFSAFFAVALNPRYGKIYTNCNEITTIYCVFVVDMDIGAVIY